MVDEDSGSFLDRPPTDEEQEWLDTLPDEFDEDFLRHLTIRQHKLLEHHAQLSKKQRAAHKAERERINAAIRDNPAFKKLRAIGDQFRTSFTLRDLKVIKGIEGPDLTARFRRHDDFMAETLRELRESQAAAAAREREEREAELARSKAMANALDGMLEIMSDQQGLQRVEAKRNRAMSATTAVYAGVAIVIAVIAGAWTVWESWQWTTLAGIAALVITLGVAGVLGVFNKHDD